MGSRAVIPTARVRAASTPPNPQSRTCGCPPKKAAITSMPANSPFDTREHEQLDWEVQGDEVPILATGDVGFPARMVWGSGFRKVAGSSVTHTGFAFLAMGGWAFYASSGHGLAAPGCRPCRKA